MKRTKEWWATLNHQERGELVALERSVSLGGRSAYIPDDCSECGYCSTPSLSSGLCPRCSDRLDGIIAKADEAMAPDYLALAAEEPTSQNGDSRDAAEVAGAQ